MTPRAADHPPSVRNATSIAQRRSNELKGFRAVATRYGKRERIYQGTIGDTSIKIWPRDPVP